MLHGSAFFMDVVATIFNLSILTPCLPISYTPLREQAYSNILTTKKNESFQMKNSKILHISAQNIDCGYSLEPPHQGGSNEYSQSVF